MAVRPVPTSPSTCDTFTPPGELPLGSPIATGEVLDAEAIAEAVDWFSFHLLWGELEEAVLVAIAQALRRFTVDPGGVLYPANQAAAGMYFLKWGTVEIVRQSAIGQTHIRYYNAGELLGYVPLVDVATEAVYEESAIALTPCEVWFLPKAEFHRLFQTHPSLQRPINRLLVQDLTHIARRVSQEELRIQSLQPYIRPTPKAIPFVGSSKFAQKLRDQIQGAAADMLPVTLQAPVGSGKTFLAGKIHTLSGIKERPFAEIDCAQFPTDEAGIIQTDGLFGRDDEEPGVIELLERGTLLIDNVQRLPEWERDRLLHYLKTGTLTRNGATNSSPATPVHSWVRLILCSPKTIDLASIPHHALKLPNLSQRKGDIPELAQHFLQRFTKEQGRQAENETAPLRLNQADLRRLISYRYPGDLSELADILKRAVLMTPPGQSVIPEQVLWSVQSEKNAFRVDLLNQYPWLRRFLLSRWWPQGFWIPMMLVFVLVTLMGYLGPQTRDASFTLNFFWAWWWPLYLFLFAFIGRVWCAVCPFMITAEWLRSLSLWLFPRQLRPWPTQWMNRWGAWILFAGFVAIYLWEELWDLPHTPYLSSWLLLVITAGAVIFSLVYERRLWCRYLCPIGGMNGMFAKLSMVELRSTQQVCGIQCSTFGCYRGSDATPVAFADALPNEGQATGGCPLYSHPAQLPDNRDCMLCMTCLKACPNRSGQLNLRFPATDLLEGHRGFWAEVALLLLLLGGVFMHHGHRLLGWLGYGDLPIDADHLLPSGAIALSLLSIPALLTFGVHQLSRWGDRQLPDYLTLVYAYLPLTLAANLTHYIPAAITEAGTILPVIARTFGYSGAMLPTLTWSTDVAQFLQGVTLLSAFVFSLYPLHRIANRPWLSLLPHAVLMLGFTVFFFYLMV